MIGHPCPFCGELVDPQASSTWRRIQGWEHKAVASSRRSGSDIALREPLDEYAHSSCIKLEKAGLNPRQSGLFAP